MLNIDILTMKFCSVETWWEIQDSMKIHAPYNVTFSYANDLWGSDICIVLYSKKVCTDVLV